MTPGTKVILLQDRSTGILVRQASKDTWIVDLDGFELELPERELVPAQQPAPASRPSPCTAAPEVRPAGAAAPARAQIPLPPTLWTEIAITNPLKHTLHLCNGTAAPWYYTAWVLTAGLYRRVASGSIQPGQYAALYTYDYGDGLTQTDLLVDTMAESLIHEPTPPQPLRAAIKLRNKTYQRPPQYSALGLGQVLPVQQLWPQAAAPAAETAASAEEKTPASAKAPNEQVVDLHLDALTDDPTLVKKDHILPLQLNAFRSALEAAVQAGQLYITFVHGVGNGVLRDKLLDELKHHPCVEHWGPLLPEYAAWGATRVRLAPGGRTKK